MADFPGFNEADRSAWDQETGAPGISLFGNAIQVWAVLQDRDVSIAEAALTFNVPPIWVAKAVLEHAWMYLTLDGRMWVQPDGADYSKLIIQHEGE